MCCASIRRRLNFPNSAGRGSALPGVLRSAMSACSSSFADLHRFVTGLPWTKAHALTLYDLSQGARNTWVEQLVELSDGRFRTWRVRGMDGETYAAFAVNAPAWWSAITFEYPVIKAIDRTPGCALLLHEGPRCPVPGGVRAIHMISADEESPVSCCDPSIAEEHAAFFEPDPGMGSIQQWQERLTQFLRPTEVD